MKELNLISNQLKVIKVTVSDDYIAEVTLLDQWNNKKKAYSRPAESQMFLQGVASYWKAM